MTQGNVIDEPIGVFTHANEEPNGKRNAYAQIRAQDCGKPIVRTKTTQRAKTHAEGTGRRRGEERQGERRMGDAPKPQRAEPARTP